MQRYLGRTLQAARCKECIGANEGESDGSQRRRDSCVSSEITLQPHACSPCSVCTKPRSSTSSATWRTWLPCRCNGCTVVCWPDDGQRACESGQALPQAP